MTPDLRDQRLLARPSLERLFERGWRGGSPRTKNAPGAMSGRANSARARLRPELRRDVRSRP